MSLLAVTGPLVDSARVQALAGTHGLDVKATELATNSKRIGDGDIPSSSFDVIVSVGRPGDHELTYMTMLSRVLRPGGRLTIVEDGVSGASLRKHLTLAGLTLADEHEGFGTVSAMKPKWETGARLALRGAAASTVSVGAPSQSVAQPSWKLSGLDDDADDLIDEDDLLTEADRARPDPASCSKPKAKACKNCTCGRAEEENAVPVKLTQAMLENPTSGCGSCALGDAYRCGTCPYLGLPSFELGKKIELPANFLVSDL